MALLRSLAISSKKALTPARSAQGLTTAMLPSLLYEYNALEPVISGEIMRFHHLKHHQTYVTNYNTVLELLDLATEKGDASIVVGLQLTIKFNGGDHVNHSIFWKNLKPISASGREPSHMKLGWQIDTNFGSFEALISKMNVEGVALQGSGWVGLKRLIVDTTGNQDPRVTRGATLVPLLGIDVWEHAYYPQYKNLKADYLKNIWKVINWEYAGEVYENEAA